MVKKTKGKLEAEKQEAERTEFALRGKALSCEPTGSGITDQAPAHNFSLFFFFYAIRWKIEIPMQYVQGYAWDFVGVKNGYDGITTRKSSEIVFPKELVKEGM